MADARGLDPGAVGPELAWGVSAEWTSLAHMRPILALEESLGRQRRPDEIVSLANIGSVDKLLSAKKSSSPDADRCCLDRSC
ncbi:hypothetical protein MUB52_18520 [Roseobacter sp. WL0113]|uniref:Uncharacterized protein n=2 Tax=Roseobacter sinensis TaxID=2931391 RepID=A0ABT3BIM8_9RHOB|nr:hypothetical protein [Roseobacter sp. WL0113]